jgi:hypothetical protein
MSLSKANDDDGKKIPGLTGYFFPQKKTRCGAVAGGSPSKNPQCGAVAGGHPRSTGTGDRHRTRSAFWTSPSVTMGVGEDDDEDWNSRSGEDDGDCEGCDDDDVLIETPTPTAGSAGPILHFPERSEDTAWLFPEGIKTASDVNKMKPETLPTVRKRKEMISAKVAKYGSVVDLWLRDKVKPETWDKNSANFPQDNQCETRH